MGHSASGSSYSTGYLCRGHLVAAFKQEMLRELESLNTYARNNGLRNVFFRKLKAGFGFFSSGILQGHHLMNRFSDDVEGRRAMEQRRDQLETISEEVQLARLEGIKQAFEHIEGLAEGARSRYVAVGPDGLGVKRVSFPFSVDSQYTHQSRIQVGKLVE